MTLVNLGEEVIHNNMTYIVSSITFSPKELVIKATEKNEYARQYNVVF